MLQTFKVRKAYLIYVVKMVFVLVFLKLGRVSPSPFLQNVLIKR